MPGEFKASPDWLAAVEPSGEAVARNQDGRDQPDSALAASRQMVATSRELRRRSQQVRSDTDARTVRYGRLVSGCSQSMQASTQARSAAGAQHSRGGPVPDHGGGWSALSEVAAMIGWPFDGSAVPAVTAAGTAEALMRVHREMLALVDIDEDDATAAATTRRVAIAARLEHWRREYRRLAGIELDRASRRLSYRGRSACLSARELQLFAVLSSRLDRWYRPDELIWTAWHDTALSGDQLRVYIARLRRVLADLGIPWKIRNDPRRGYSVTAVESTDADEVTAPTLPPQLTLRVDPRSG